MRKQWCSFLLWMVGLAVGAPAQGADVAALRAHWRDLLVQEPAVFAPQTFRAAEAAWAACESAEQRGSADRAARASEAEKRIALLDEALARVRAAWPAVLQARTAARTAGVSEVLPREWQSAENTLMAAARKLETGRAEAGARQAEEARRAYDAARVAALRQDVLGEARATLRRLDELNGRRYVPRSYVRALDAVNQADAALQARGDADVEVRAAAARAAVEAKHALFLLERVRAVCEASDPTRLEDTVLEWEASLQAMLRTLGAEVPFETSVGAGLQAAAPRIAELTADSRRLQTGTARDAAALDSLRGVVHTLQDSLRTRELRSGANLRAVAEYSRFLGVQRAFTRDEGRVFLDNRDVVLRLPGVQFAPGASSLDGDAPALLDRVAEVLRGFPGATVVVEGHTDAQGVAADNQALSQRRAQAVRAYLMDKVPLPASRISAVGWGSARPVVAEATDADRALNRRIEIIVSPGE